MVDVVSTGQAGRECRELTTFSPDFIIYDGHKRHPHLGRAFFLTVSKQLDCIALNTPNLNKARYVSAKGEVDDICTTIKEACTRT